MSTHAVIAVCVTDKTPEFPDQLLFYTLHVQHDGEYQYLGKTLERLMEFDLYPEEENDPPQKGSMVEALNTAALQSDYEERKFLLMWLFNTSRNGWSSLENADPTLAPVQHNFYGRTECEPGAMVGYNIDEIEEPHDPDFCHEEHLHDIFSDYFRGYTFVCDETAQTITMTSYAMPVGWNRAVIAQTIYGNGGIIRIIG